MRSAETWYSQRVGEWVTMTRWGSFGTPVLVFPTAGGDAYEIERCGLIDALSPLLAGGRIKVYSVDSISGRSWLLDGDPLRSMWLQNRFDDFVISEAVPAIRQDCLSDDIEIITAGASIGAFWALELLTRHPDVVRTAICMSGTFDLEPWLHGHWSDDFYYSSPLHFLPGLEGEALRRLQDRFVVLATGTGAWEDPGQSWRAAAVLGAKGVPNRVDLWSEHHAHDWPTWREMLPLYLDSHTG